MFRNLLMGAAALTLMTGAALAEPVAAGGVSGAALGVGVGCPATQFAPWPPGTTKSAAIRNVKSHQLAARHLINQTIAC